MEARSYLRVILCFAILFIGLQSCCTKSKSASGIIPAGAVPVTVIDYHELDGCTYLLELENKQKLQPVNLPLNFQKNGLRLYVLYKPKSGTGICMAGTMIELTFMQEIK